MKIINPKIYVEKFNGIQIMKRIERACRTCYRSEGKITEDSYKKLLTNCIIAVSTCTAIPLAAFSVTPKKRFMSILTP